MGIVLALLLFAVIASVISVFGYLHYVRPSRLLAQLTTSTSDALPTRLEIRPANGKAFSFSGLFKSIGELIPVSPQDAALAKNDLIAAGYRSGTAVPIYYGTKFCGAALVLALGLSFRGH